MTIDPKHSPAPGPAVLVEVTRGPIVESVHYGVIAAADAEGNLLAWLGDPGFVSYYRSSSKPIQAVPLVESGAADHFGLTEREIAICCGSHGGEDIHEEAVLSILDKIGLGTDALACGPHAPYDKAAARLLAERGGPPTVLHNNCSGKHAGMLALARFHGWPVGGYESSLHPVQHAMHKVVAEFAGLAPEDVPVGVDGCGVLTFGLTIQGMAVSFARLANADYWPEPRRSAVRRITRAMIAYPEYVAARQQRFDTDLMRAAGGTLISKVGAEGVFCAALLPEEDRPALGFALKVLDGDNSLRARNPSVTEGLRQTAMLTEEALNKLETYWVEEIRNRPGDVVGMVRPAFTLSVPGD
ncbi:MAG TPA: asparaginase [Chloroflexia bacterium]|jgi:L-asparaginase II